MKNILLVDFGSTCTKVTAVDVDRPKVMGTSASYTTVETDINQGFLKAKELLESKIGPFNAQETYACSSAAGGLKMVAIGLVPELTVQAAREASLGAGAKVMKNYAYRLTKSDIREIDGLCADIILLTGGTDGGNYTSICHNAEMLAKLETNVPIIIAGNRSCGDACCEILEHKEIYLCRNVMPVLGKLDIAPAQEIIRDIFLKRIITARGLSKAADLVSDIIMPTPKAMLTAMELLAQGCGQMQGLGELVAVDLGGATTDVYSIADGNPTDSKTVYKGIEEPYAKRTVEGDIGMRYSIWGVAEVAGLQKLSLLSRLPESRIEEMLHWLDIHKDAIPEPPEFKALEYALASQAVEIATIRHAGTIEQVYTPMGETWLQIGKDLRNVKNLIVTGGALIHAVNPEKILSHALYEESKSFSLRPKNANIYIDKNYILAAMGLLSKKYPNAAFEIMNREIKKNGFKK